MTRVLAIGLAVLTAIGATAGCATRRSQGIDLSSIAFAAGGRIPARYSCVGENLSPPLQWKNVPFNTEQFALVVSDPDAPKGTFYHWVLFGLGGDRRSLGENEVPAGAVQGRSSSDAAGYVGMCPPDGETHTYRFTIYALDAKLALPQGASIRSVLSAVKDHEVARGELRATFRQ